MFFSVASKQRIPKICKSVGEIRK